jgi:asparagine synthase (glutamine-hydrolysing)
MIQFWMSISPADAAAPAPGSPLAPVPERCAFERLLAGRQVRVFLGPAALADACIADGPQAATIRLGKTHCAPARPGALDDDDPTLLIDTVSAKARIFVPYSSTTQLFVARQGDTLRLATDPRLLVLPGFSIDPQAILCLLTFGALTAPYALWREIRRLEPGVWTEIDLANLALRHERVDLWGPPQAQEGALAAPAQEEIVRERLDRVLRRLAPDERPVLLFSGGVDSGLLAARARALGWRETLLINYSMGPQDREAALAAAMARALGLPFLAIEDDAAAWAAPIAGLARNYPQPVGDYSLIPTGRLCDAVLERAGGRASIWDGSGADGVFGAFPKLARWRRLYALPAALRALGAAAYRAGGFWRNDTSLGRRLAAARITRQMPFLLASMIAEHPLRGIAYDAGEADVRALHAAIAAAIAAATAELAVPEAASRALDLRHIVCDFTAQKDAPRFLGREPDIAYPFLDPELVRLGMRAAWAWPEQAVSKAVLKRLLAQGVPAEMVYRPKSGFMPPIAQAFRVEPLRGALAAAIAPESPLAPYLRREVLLAMAGCAARGTLPHRVYNFLWTVVCVAHWMMQFESAQAGWPRGRD